MFKKISLPDKFEFFAEKTKEGKWIAKYREYYDKSEMNAVQATYRVISSVKKIVPFIQDIKIGMNKKECWIEATYEGNERLVFSTLCAELLPRSTLGKMTFEELLKGAAGFAVGAAAMDTMITDNKVYEHKAQSHKQGKQECPEKQEDQS